MEKCRYIALTDINPGHFPWTEKDDIQSLVRLLLYIPPLFWNTVWEKTAETMQPSMIWRQLFPT